MAGTEHAVVWHEPGRLSLALQGAGIEEPQRLGVRGLDHRPVRRDLLAQPAQLEVPSVADDVGREARVHVPVRLADVRKGGGGARQFVGHAVEDRGGEPASGLQMRRDSAQHPRPRRFGADHLDELHRGDREAELASQVEPADIRPLGVDGQPLGRRPFARRRDEISVQVDRRYLVPSPRQVQGDPARPASEVEDRPVGLRCEPLPCPQVGRVGPALGVVPDHLRARAPIPRAHAQYSRARPRLASTVRSSSRAV